MIRLTWLSLFVWIGAMVGGVYMLAAGVFLLSSPQYASPGVSVAVTATGALILFISLRVRRV